MKTLVHDIARLTGLSLLIALALAAIVIASSPAAAAPADSAGSPIAVPLDRLESASLRAWPLVALAVARPALRAVRLAIVETIRIADVLVFRNYGVQRLAHFTGAERIHGLRWTSDAVTAGHLVARLASREVAALRHRG
jgi:hypothetical protein